MCLSKSTDFLVKVASCLWNSFLCLWENPNPAIVLTESLVVPVGIAWYSKPLLLDNVEQCLTAASESWEHWSDFTVNYNQFLTSLILEVFVMHIGRHNLLFLNVNPYGVSGRAKVWCHYNFFLLVTCCLVVMTSLQCTITYNYQSFSILIEK